MKGKDKLTAGMSKQMLHDLMVLIWL